jgi:hypothetical protein
MIRPGFLVLAFLLALAWAGAVQAAKIRFDFRDWAGPPVRVHATRPVNLEPDRPVLFVIHGSDRDASLYRDHWTELAKEHDFLLVVPEISGDAVPGGDSLALLEPLFEEVRRRWSMTTGHYLLYGHESGASFAHRFVLLVPDVRASLVVAANPDHYTLPTFSRPFPAGLGRTGVSPEHLARSFRLPLTVLLDEEDALPANDREPVMQEVLEPAAKRLETAREFLETARETAGRLNTPLNWRLVTVPGAGPGTPSMAPAALPYLLEN